MKKVSSDDSDPNTYSETFGSADGKTALSIIYSKNTSGTTDLRNIYSVLDTVEENQNSSETNIAVNCRVEKVKIDYVACQYVNALSNGKYAYVIQTIIPDQRDFDGVIDLTGLFSLESPDEAQNLLRNESFLTFGISVEVYSVFTIEFN